MAAAWLGSLSLAALAALAPDFLPVVALGLLVFVVGLLELRLLLYLAVFLIPWQIYLMNIPGSTYTFRLEDVVVFVLALLTAARYPRTLRLGLTGWMAPILAFTGVAILAGLADRDAYATAKFAADWWPILALYWVLLAWRDRVRWTPLTLLLLLSFCMQAALGVAQTAIGDLDTISSFLRSPMAEVFFDRDVLVPRLAEESFNFFWRGRSFAFGTYLAATGFAVVLAATAVVSWGLALGRRREFRPWLLWCFGTLLLAACLLTLKRTGLLAALAGILTIVISRQRGGLSAFAGRVLVLLIAGSLTLGLAHWKDAEFADRMTDQSGSGYSREYILPLYVGLALQRPVFGYGPGYPMGSEETGFWEGSDYQFGPENSFLHLALTAGLTGLALFVWPFLYGLRRLWASTKAMGRAEAQAITAGLAAFAMGGMFVVAVGDLKACGLPFFLLAWAHHVVGKSPGGVTHRAAI